MNIMESIINDILLLKKHIVTIVILLWCHKCTTNVQFVQTSGVPFTNMVYLILGQALVITNLVLCEV